MDSAGVLSKFLMRAFGRPEGALGRLGGHVMARMNRECAYWVISLLGVQPTDAVLEVGYGSGVAAARLATLTRDGRVAGVDTSDEMVAQATQRNSEAIAAGRVDLRHGSVGDLPFGDETFDKALAINSMQVWPSVTQGLDEVRRVLKTGGTIALGFTRHSGQSPDELISLLSQAGFQNPSLATKNGDVCARALKG